MSVTVLIVEDEPEIAETLRYAFASEGMQPVHVNTCGSAARLLTEKNIDIVILDVGLPDGNGFEFLKTLRQFNQVPVLMLTARSDEVDRIVGLEIGADDYVTKPFSPREVVARIRAILKRGGNNQSDVSMYRFEHRPAAMQISFDNSVLELTRSEYLLLAALLSRSGQIFSRRQLIEAVWSSQHPSDDRVIDTHVKSLRSKLKKIDSSAEPIVTHRGFGYSMASEYGVTTN